jgi:heme/copper-type cytochrome/quinol oxidase subunit 4
VELYLHFPTRGRGAMCNEVRYVFRAWCLVKHRENFTFTFYLHMKRKRKTFKWSVFHSVVVVVVVVIIIIIIIIEIILLWFSLFLLEL